MIPNNVVLITGASSGIGKVIATTLAANGCQVFGTSRKPADAEPGTFAMVELDVTDDLSVSRCIEYVQRKAGRLDVLINNVGSLVFGSAEETTIAETIRELELNFLGTVRMTRAVIPLMRQQGNGNIINISSLAGLAALPFNSASSAGKFALEGYSEALRYELLTFNIYVSLIELAATKTSEDSRSMSFVNETIAAYNDNRESAYQQMTRDVETTSTTKQDVANQILKIIGSEKSRLRYPIGMQTRVVPILKSLLPQNLFERQILARMRTR